MIEDDFRSYLYIMFYQNMADIYSNKKWKQGGSNP